MDVEPWEALDLDDSDLPSLLRPCKQQRSTSTAAADAAKSAAANTRSELRYSQPPEENHHEQQRSQPSTSGRRTIPGPAGAVQAAMLRKNIDRANQIFSDNRGDNGDRLNNEVISTQDYVRRAMEDTAEFDDDFTRHPWLSAIQYIGAENGVIHSTPISSMKKCLNVGKAVQVVAVVKSCTSNGLGGLIALLKDPTGTIGASIHHKVLSESEFGKNLTIGAVLILREVAIFSPVRSAHYLNITLRNLVKVFSQDSGSTSKLNNSAYALKYADPGIEYCGRAKRLENMFKVQNVTMEDVEHTKCTKKAENLQNHSVSQRQIIFNGSDQFKNRASVSAIEGGREHMNLSKDACDEITKDVIRSGITLDHQEFVSGSDRGARGCNLEGSPLNNTKNTTNSVTKNSADVQGTIEVQMQRPPMISKLSLPQWTDEQLDELFAGDEEDDSLLGGERFWKNYDK